MENNDNSGAGSLFGAGLGGLGGGRSNLQVYYDFLAVLIYINQYIGLGVHLSALYWNNILENCKTLSAAWKKNVWHKLYVNRYRKRITNKMI